MYQKCIKDQDYNHVVICPNKAIKRPKVLFKDQDI